jgi:hypothetical protein
LPCRAARGDDRDRAPGGSTPRIPDHIDGPGRRPALRPPLRPALLAAIVLTLAAAGQASAGVVTATVEGSGTIAAE